MSLVLSARPLYGSAADPFEYWQPSASGLVLDLNPHFNVTLDNSLGTPHVAAITNRAPSMSDSFANANTSLQPSFEATGWVGTSYVRESMLFDGTAHYLRCATTLAQTLAGGIDNDFSLFLVAQNLDLTGTRTFLGFFKSNATGPIWDVYTESSLYKFNRRDDAASLVSVTGGTPNTSKHVLEMIFSGTALTFKVDGTTILNAVSQDVGDVTFDSLVLGATYTNGLPQNWGNVRIARLLGFTGALNSTDAADVRASLTAMYL